MLGMHGSVYANWVVRDCDLLLALGVRFDDRVTGKLAAFAKHAKIVHVDIDPSELNKNKPPMINTKRTAAALTIAIVGPWRYFPRPLCSTAIMVEPAAKDD